MLNRTRLSFLLCKIIFNVKSNSMVESSYLYNFLYQYFSCSYKNCYFKKTKIKICYFIFTPKIMISEVETTGTTIIGFKYNDGIIIGADSRTTNQQMISSPYTDKIEQISPNIFACRCGVASQTQKLLRIVGREVNKLALKEDTLPSVSKAAHLLKRIIYPNKDFLLTSLIVAGYDGEFGLFKIYRDGTILNDDILISGSGSIYCSGFADAHYRADMNLEEALDFGSKMVRLSCNRDHSSGGVIRMVSINKEGSTRYFMDGNKVFLS